MDQPFSFAYQILSKPETSSSSTIDFNLSIPLSPKRADFVTFESTFFYYDY